ncbi:MAG TPA: response regulator [Rickettsiales bacterium]|nr:response regulator [Rickettsiales bacterium]
MHAVISIEQIKAARMMLNLKQVDLAKKAGISLATLNNIERGVQTDPKISTMKSIQQALEREGIEFTADALGGVGVSLKPQRKGSDSVTVLIVDDNKADRTLYKTWLGRNLSRKYRVVEADNARAGFDAFVEWRPQCLILDFMMYGADGFQLLASLKREHAKLPPVVFVTAMHNDILQENAKSQGVSAYLPKQALSRELLCGAVDDAVRRIAS